MTSPNTTPKPVEGLGESPNYIGMGTLSIPKEIIEALHRREDTRQQAKHKYGYHRENILIDADNQLVLAIEAHTLRAVIKELEALAFTDREKGCMDCQSTTIVENRITTLQTQLERLEGVK